MDGYRRLNPVDGEGEVARASASAIYRPAVQSQGPNRLPPSGLLLNGETGGAEASLVASHLDVYFAAYTLMWMISPRFSRCNNDSLSALELD